MRKGMLGRIGLIAVFILLGLACEDKSSVPTAPYVPKKQDVWCELKFKITIKAAEVNMTRPEYYKDVRFEFRAHTYNQIKDLGEVILSDPFGTIEKEWEVDGFKTGTEGKFDFIYMAHMSPGGLGISRRLNTMSAQGGEKFAITLQITERLFGVIISPSYFSEEWTADGGDRKSFRFALAPK